MPLPSKYLTLIQTGTPPENLITRGCLSPRKIFVYNSVTCQNEPLYVDCGHCTRCKDQRREEMATRMILHRKSKPWAHAYFITLTYGSYNLSEYYSHPFLHDWLETFPVCDKYNSKGRPSWTPSILVPSHFTKFMKRLRFLLPNHIISYCVAGELGGTYGRPHFHAILYSDKHISRFDICRAWSFDCYRKSPKYISRYCGSKCNNLQRFTFSIGRVDYHDLNVNGTCDFDSIKNPSEVGNIGAKNCFAYVAKYCVKGVEKMNPIAEKRYLRVWNQLEDSLHIVENKFSQNQNILLGDKVYFADSYLCDEDIDIITNSVKEYIANAPIAVNIPPFLVDFIINKFYITKKVKRNGKLYQNIDFKKFCSIFGTYFSTSRMYSIGKNYFFENLENFERQNYALRKVQGKSLVFPSYFYRLLEMQKFGIRFRARVESGVSLCKGSLPLVEGFFTKLRECQNVHFLPSCTFQASHYFPTTKNVNFPSDPSIGFINPYTPNKGSLLDITLFKGRHYRSYIYDQVLDEFIGLEYNRKTKSFFHVDFIKRIDMCDFVLSRIRSVYDRLEDVSMRKRSKLLLYETLYNCADDFDLSNFNLDVWQRKQLKTEHINSRYIESLNNFENLRNILQSQYDSEHLTKDNQ